MRGILVVDDGGLECAVRVMATRKHRLDSFAIEVVLLGRVGVLDRQGVGPREEVGANQGGWVLVGAGRGVFRVGWG